VSPAESGTRVRLSWPASWRQQNRRPRPEFSRLLHLFQEPRRQFGNNDWRPIRELNLVQPVLLGPKLRYGLSDTNITHNFVLSYSYIFPTFSSAPALVRAVAGGCRRGILLFQTGQPMTALISGDAIGENKHRPHQLSQPCGRTGLQSLINPGNVTITSSSVLVPTTPVVSRVPIG